MEINPKNPDEDCTTEQSTGGIDFHNLNHSHQHKTMKRLHQLSINTAKAAINEMRLMHSYFSTPYYLLKFRDINKMKANATIQETGNGNLSHFWSILFGNSVIDDFSTNIDSINLNKYSLIKKHNSGMNFLLENLDKQRLCSHSSEHNSIKNSQNNEERQHERSNSPGKLNQMTNEYVAIVTTYRFNNFNYHPNPLKIEIACRYHLFKLSIIWYICRSQWTKISSLICPRR